MLTRDNIIQTALLKLGETDSYNDNRTREYQIAEFLLNKVLNEVAYDTTYLFNATTVTLTSTGIVNVNDENLFNLPTDFLNMVRANVQYRLEGEYIVSDEIEIVIQYCRTIPLEEYPDYMGKLLEYMLAVELAESINSLSANLQLVDMRVREEREEVLIREGWKPIWNNLRSTI